ncbi:MAG: hypothetical protein KAS32_25035 [Candidatus Peribacteraceae bacterium]|nr:hypothetical protein [Candidatus Peribacteraceae bacterium]
MPEDSKEFNPKDLEAVHKEAIEEHRLSSDAVHANHLAAQDDVDFLQGGENQWLAADWRSRKSRGAPTLTINPLNVFVGRVVGDMLLNKPAIKAVPVDGDSDPESADIRSGLISNIEYQSKAGQVWKHIGKQQVGHGFGYFEVITEYTGYPSNIIDNKPVFSDTAFEQDIKLKKIKNSFSVIPDENSQDITLADSMKCFIERRISRANFKKEYPGEDATSFPQAKTLYPNYFSSWFGENDLMIVKYYRRIKKTVKIIQLSDGRVMLESDLRNNKDLLDEVGPLTIENERDAHYFEVYKYIVTGDKVIDGPHKIMSSMIPVGRAAGRTLEVGDYTIYRGLIRDAKDAQMMANYWISTIAESLTTAPKAPYIVTAKQVAGYEKIWQNSSRVNYAYLPFNVDTDAPGLVPQRTPPAFLPEAAFIQYQQMGADTKNTIGLQDASLGIQTGDRSGIALQTEERQGNVQTFEFVDNLNDAIAHSGKIMLEMIPNVYDTRRIVRLLNPDGSTEEVILNNRIQDPQDSFNVLTENEMAVGKYDIRVETGPSFTTKRQETARQLLELGKILNPEQAAAIMPFLVGSLDINNSDAITSILKKLAPPGLIDPEEGEEPPQPPPPSPEQQLEAAKLEVEAEKVKVDMAKVQVDAAKVEQEGRVFTPEEVEEIRELAREESLDVAEEVGVA